MCEIFDDIFVWLYLMLLFTEIWAQGLVACSVIAVAVGSLRILTCKRNIFYSLPFLYQTSSLLVCPCPIRRSIICAYTFISFTQYSLCQKKISHTYYRPILYFKFLCRMCHLTWLMGFFLYCTQVNPYVVNVGDYCIEISWNIHRWKIGLMVVSKYIRHCWRPCLVPSFLTSTFSLTFIIIFFFLW